MGSHARSGVYQRLKRVEKGSNGSSGGERVVLEKLSTRQRLRGGEAAYIRGRSINEGNNISGGRWVVPEPCPPLYFLCDCVSDAVILSLDLAGDISWWAQVGSSRRRSQGTQEARAD